MPGKSEPTAEAAASELVIERVFDAPRELVWRAWTDPEHMAKWWGPTGWTLPVCEIDLRVGGRLLSAMRSPEGQDIWGTGVFQEIVPPERLVFTDSFADEHGNVVSAADYGMGDDFPLEMLITVTFEDLGGKTRMTLRHSGLPAGEHLEGANQGWSQSLDKLAEHLTNMRD